MARRVLSTIAFTLLALCIAAAGTVLATDPIHAQGGDNDYVDVGLILEVPDDPAALLERELDIIVVNHGSRTAYDVEVVVKIEYPQSSSHFHEIPEVPVGRASLENSKYTLRWSIPALGGLQREEVTAEVMHKEKVTNPSFDKSCTCMSTSGR